MTIAWRAYCKLMRFDRPVGTLLLLWPTLAALCLASEGPPPFHILGAFVVGTIIMRAAGCAVNDIADRKFDPHVERTRERPLATGELKLYQAWVCFSVLIVLGFGIVLTLNAITRWMAVVGLLVAMGYPVMKRVTHFAQLGLGIAFSWGILMAGTAVTGTIPTVIWLFFASSFLWIVAYDTEYAMVDREYDLNLGLHSTAILFGSFDRIAVALLNSAVLVLWLLVGMAAQLTWIYFLALAAIACLFSYQSFLLRDRETGACFRAFRNNATVGLILFFGIVGHYLLSFMLR